MAAAASFALVLPTADAATLTSVARQRHGRSGNRLRRQRAEPKASAEEEFGSSEDKAHRVGPGGCFNIWRSTEDHCMVKTKCAAQNITDYSFSLVCKDKADGVVRHQFGKDSFDNEETFDTLIICKSCEPDAIEEKKLVFNLPVAGAKGSESDGDVKKLSYDLPEANESAKTPSLEEQVKELTGEVKELKNDMELAESAVEKLNAKVFAPGAPAPAPPAYAPAAAAPPAAPVHLRAHRKRQRQQPPVQHQRRQPRVVEDGDQDEDEDGTEVSNPPQPPAQAAVLATSTDEEEEQQQDDGGDDEDARSSNSEQLQQQQAGTLRQACYMNLNELTCEGECVWNKGRKACEEPNEDEDDNVQQAQTVVMTSRDSEDANSQDNSGDDADGDSEGSESTEEDEDSSQASASEATEPEPENDEE